MSMKLSSKKQYLVLDNQKLVHYLVNKLGVTQNSSEYEDLVSIGTIGLVKAAITFDTSKNITFSTYASRCIHNEIFMHFKKAKKYANNISIDESIGNDVNGQEFTLRDILADSKSNFVDKIINKESYINLVSIVLNSLKGKHRLVILYLMGNISQKEIANKLNISRSYVSRIQKIAKLEIQKIANKQVHYKEVFSMAIVEDEYRISFSSKNINEFNKIFATLLKNVKSVKNLPDFKVNCNRERIIIQIPAHPESFSFIAEIIQEIDDFSMSFVSNKTTISANNTDINKFETDDTNDTLAESEKKAVEVQISDQNVPTLTGVDKVNNTNPDSKVQKESQLKQVREYMLSLNSFTVKDLKLHFPNLSPNTIKNALYLAKRKGLITSIDRGRYNVNKF